MRKIEDWDFNAQHVQNDISSGRFVNSKSILVAFGPPRFHQIARGNQSGANQNETEDPVLKTSEMTEDAFKSSIFMEQGSYAPVPVGLVQEMTMRQAKEMSKIFELGSSKSYQVPARSSAALSLNRIMYDGPSLLKYSMAYYLKRLQNGQLGGVDEAKLKNMVKTTEAIQLSGTNKPGFDHFFINLSSDLFNFPIGVMFYFKNNAGLPYGAMYLEDAHISNHGLSVQVGMSVVAESISIEFDNPIGVNTYNSENDIE